MSGYSHLTADERDRLAGLKADGLSLGAIARTLGRATSTISRELRRNALDSGAYRRWLPHSTDLDELGEADIQEIAMTINLTPRKCLGYRSPVEAFLSELGRAVEIRFA